MIKRLILLIILLCLIPISALASDCGDENDTTWCVPLSNDFIDIDGSTFCDGPCVGGVDTITVEGGTKTGGNYEFKNFDGDGDYVVIQNSDSERVILNGNSSYGTVFFRDCSYIDFRGDNLAGTTYGFYVSNSSGISCAVRIFGTADHIKISYVEATNSFFFNDSSKTETTIWSDIEVSYFYIHNTPTEGMYMGASNIGDNFDFDTINIHDGRIENSGWDGLQLAHAKFGSNSIYNMTIINSGILEELQQGKGIIINPEMDGVEIYNCYIKNSWEQGLYLYVDSANINVHDNVFYNVGTQPNSGIKNESYGNSNIIINNTIVGAGTDGISSNSEQADIQYNLIVASGDAACDSADGSDDCAATYNNEAYATIAEVYFTDYLNDDFSLTYQSPVINNSDDTAGYSVLDFNGDTRPYGDTDADPGAYEFTFKIVNMTPIQGAEGQNLEVDANWNNPVTTTSNTIYFDKSAVHDPPTTELHSGSAVETHDLGTLDPDTEYVILNNLTHADGTETGTKYYFTTTGGPPITSSEMTKMVIDPGGGRIIIGQ